ncbi:MAG TPA: VWA domain-containing protein [Chloroflexi bacterium]|nr:VWA domain-containing protein [Chloroflexota bacterium]
MNWGESVRPTARKTIKTLVAPLTLLLFLSLSLSPGLTNRTGKHAQTQQDEPLNVAITRIEHRHFPLVTVDVTVTGPDGSPVEQLGSDNFRIFEDGEEDGEANEPVTSASLVVEQNDAQSLNAILALDVHTSNERLAQIQTAMGIFIKGIGEQDKVALLTFYDEVQVIQRFTGNQEILQTSLDSLTAQGTRSALDKAISEALALADEHGASRTAIILVTDGGSETVALDQAQASNVPVYVVRIGDQITSESLSDLARQTGGQFYAAQNTHEIADALQTIVWLLRQGYQVRYWSDIEPDGRTHALTVRVVTHQGVGETQGYIEAQLNKVDVSLVGIVDGQPVIGTFHLSAEVSTPAPVKSVTYRLDGEILAERDEPPYTFAWDTTGLAPGDHTLTVQVVDRAGNGGSARVSVQVPPPPSPPPPPQPAPAWQRYTMGLTLLIALGAVALTTLTALGVALAWQRVRYRQVCRVSVKNMGNVPSRYRLQIQEPSGALNFRFALREPLPFAVPAPAAAERAEVQSSARQPQAAPRPQPKPQPGSQQRPERAPSSINLHGAREKANWLMNVSRAVADTIGAIGALLPSSMGRPLKNLSTQLRQQQTAASRAQKAPGEFVGRVQRIPKRMSRVQPAATKRAASSREQIAPDTPSLSIERGMGRETDQERRQATKEERIRSQQRPIAVLEQENGWTRTPSTPPGERLPLDLLVTPVGRPAQTQIYPFTVIATSLEQASEAPAKKVDGRIEVAEVSWLHHTLPFFALAGLVLVELALVALIFASTLSAFTPR